MVSRNITKINIVEWLHVDSDFERVRAKCLIYSFVIHVLVRRPSAFLLPFHFDSSLKSPTKNYIVTSACSVIAQKSSKCMILIEHIHQDTYAYVVDLLVSILLFECLNFRGNVRLLQYYSVCI